MQARLLETCEGGSRKGACAVEGGLLSSPMPLTRDLPSRECSRTSAAQGSAKLQCRSEQRHAKV